VSRLRPRATAIAPALIAAALLAGCGGKESTLDPESPPARDIATLWWWMLGISAVVFFGAVGLLGIAAIRRRTEGLPVFGKDEGLNKKLVVGFGIVIPAAVLIPLFIVANLSTVHATEAPRPSTTRMTIQIVGHQWFWEVRYPGTKAVTANEVHIPAHTRVNVIATTADVIHSLWVPRLNRKIDMIPGRRNRILFYAARPGVFRGQCSEFCGLQHAKMGMEVHVDPPARFRAWLQDMESAAPAPTGAAAQRGARIFQASSCASCHTIRGTQAQGRIGPDLTHFGGRSSIASVTIPNTPAYLREWIRDPQHVKPGNKMPAVPLHTRDIAALTAYLEGLK
jgi:cytochrome c oxidase subunit 2